MRLCLCVNMMEPPLDREGFFFFFSLPSFLPQVFGEADGPPFVPGVADGVEEKFIPEKCKPRGQGGLYQAGPQALKQAPGPLLPGYLDHAVQQAPVAPHLSARITALGLGMTPQMARGEPTCPKWTLASSKPPTCSLFLKRSRGYVMVLLIIPAPPPHSRLRRSPATGSVGKGGWLGASLFRGVGGGGGLTHLQCPQLLGAEPAAF